MSSSDSDDGPVRRGNVAIHSSGSTSSNRSESGNEAKNGSDKSRSGSPPSARSGGGSTRSSASPPPERRIKRNLIESDEEEEDAQNNQPAAHNVFGDDVSSDSERSEAEPPKRQADSDDEGNKSDASRKSDDSIQGIRMVPEEAEQEESQAPIIHQIEMSKAEVNFEDEEGQYFAKMPNFLSIETRPFDPENYDEDDDDDQLVDEEGRNRLKLRVENTIRWRYAEPVGEGENVIPDEERKKESNSKIVKWSDGTMSLYLGNEIFEIQALPLTNYTHLYVRQSAGLIGQAVFEKKLQFRPHSTESSTHRKITMSMADRSRKTAQVLVLDDMGQNPDEKRKEAIRREEEALRAQTRREAQQRRYRERSSRGLTAGYLEGREDSDDEFEARRRSYKRGTNEAPLIGASESEDSDDGGKRLDAAKEQAEDDSDEEFRRKKQQQKKTIAVSDEESD
ncbi:hypothetical protein WR25_00128 [Diploscapter pachys]|uniref:Leo1-like protein n=1 Tax=Diploscapter pachys TaxID=2018661 RepID=A0A2A2KST9_9BILA|nr:hypothetical protein WR25_00128 [Diploscapter pachys]